MATLRIEIKGELGVITVCALMETLAANLRMLDDYDRGISREAGAQRKTLKWFVADVTRGSIGVSLRSESLSDSMDVGLRVVEQHVNGWHMIESDGATPPYLSIDSMQQAQRAAKLIGREGVAGFSYAALNGREERTDVSGRSVLNLGQLLPVRHHSIGSVEGMLETVSVHRGKHFTIYLSRTKKAVVCAFKDEQLLRAAIKRLQMPQGRRVSVYGTVYSNAKGEPMRVDVDHIKPLRQSEDLPTTESLTRSDPDFTGGLSTEEFLRRMRSA